MLSNQSQNEDEILVTKAESDFVMWHVMLESVEADYWFITMTRL